MLAACSSKRETRVRGEDRQDGGAANVWCVACGRITHIDISRVGTVGGGSRSAAGCGRCAGFPVFVGSCRTKPHGLATHTVAAAAASHFFYTIRLATLRKLQSQTAGLETSGRPSALVAAGRVGFCFGACCANLAARASAAAAALTRASASRALLLMFLSECARILGWEKPTPPAFNS